ncbi:hypothetical protein DYD21_05975 [Rhodohalobacter sp. SW132]|uniref:DUF5723 family protein n=1 Tax=Rhodohalobacter sp. SW132 TaxID=2293433 RepID=UPI000E2833AA|nr:DUF5723 family protein [Rhodohalobacter sp. SW132]REL38155.1 hypothetical protein DYD21_05975 [Rhodohalobacter sp. SW132]
MKSKLNQIITLFFISAVLILAAGINSAEAQSRHLTAQNIGLGGGGTAYQDLYHANFINPANLMINHSNRPKVSFGLAGGIYTNAGGNLVNITTYNDYLTNGRVIEGTVADQMLDQWFGTQSTDMRSANIDVGIVPVGFAYRSDSWSLSGASRVRVLGSSGYSRGFADLVFRGLDSDYFNEARAVNMNQEFLVYNEISVGYATTVLQRDRMFGFAENVRLHVGAAPKLVMGVNYTRFNLNSTLRIQEATSETNAQINHDFRYTIETAGELSDQLEEYNTLRESGAEPEFGDFIEPTGSDFTGIKGTSLGLDLGLTLEMDIDNLSIFNFGFFNGDKKVRVGLSLTDLGSVAIDDRNRSFSAGENFIWNGIHYDQKMVDNEFGGDDGKYFESVLKDSVGNDIYGNLVSTEHSSYSKGLPTMLNFGTHLLLGKFSLMVDAGTGFVERGTNSRRAYVALGSEYRLINRIPLRVGVKTGGHTSTTYHAGTGLEFRNFEFSVGVASSAVSEKHGAGIGAAWSGLVFHF